MHVYPRHPSTHFIHLQRRPFHTSSFIGIPFQISEQFCLTPLSWLHVDKPPLVGSCFGQVWLFSLPQTSYDHWPWHTGWCLIQLGNWHHIQQGMVCMVHHPWMESQRERYWLGWIHSPRTGCNDPHRWRLPWLQCNCPWWQYRHHRCIWQGQVLQHTLQWLHMPYHL